MEDGFYPVLIDGLKVPSKVWEVQPMQGNNESNGSQLVHVILPTVLVLIASAVSLSVDFCLADRLYWFQRSGALLAAVGIYIAFHETNWRVTLRSENGNAPNLIINTGIWYQWLALGLAILGTLVWAYGDLPFR